MKKHLYIILTFLVVVASSYISRTNAQSGGQYSITQSVVANGGGTSGNGTFQIEGTSGQPAAGTNMTNSPYGVKGGFWVAAQSAPTAAGVSVSGRVLTSEGRGLRNAFVELTDIQGVTRRVMTGSLGYFRFDGVSAGGTYVLGVSSRLYQFEARTVNLSDDLGDVVFRAVPR